MRPGLKAPAAVLALVLAATALTLPGPAPAQGTRTLADIRQELSVLFVELQRLKRELSTTGGAGRVDAQGTVLDRVGAIESELQRLTAKTEEMEFRIGRVVRDGTNRLGDLEFRVCEIEPGCDIANLQPGDTLGGVAPATGGGGDTGDNGDTAEGAGGRSAADNGTDGPQLAVGERDDFERAQAALEAGDHAGAADLFKAFRNAYPGGPLSARAGLLRGDALEAAGQQTAAARAWLDTFSAAPDAPEAPQALFRLGRALGRLGQTSEACVTLAEVAQRYPESGAVSQAQAELRRLTCQ